MKLSSERIFIRPMELADAPAQLEVRLRNRDFFQTWEPLRPESHWTLVAQEADIRNAACNWEEDRGYGFGVFLKETGAFIGRVNLANLVRGAWQNATTGYWMDAQHNGKGYATEALKLALQFAFEHAKLHRVQAGVIPRNIGSIRVVEKAGMRFEGLSLRYLKINDVWEDHNIYAITLEDWQS